MADEIITKNHPQVIAFRENSQLAFDALSEIKENHHVVLEGLSLLTDKDVAQRLRVSRRTLQNYRDAGILPYYLVGGKCLYAESDISKLLKVNYHPRFDEETT